MRRQKEAVAGGAASFFFLSQLLAACAPTGAEPTRVGLPQTPLNADSQAMTLEELKVYLEASRSNNFSTEVIQTQESEFPYPVDELEALNLGFWNAAAKANKGEELTTQDATAVANYLQMNEVILGWLDKKIAQAKANNDQKELERLNSMKTILVRDLNNIVFSSFYQKILDSILLFH